jgi:hypothetical protein
MAFATKALSAGHSKTSRRQTAPDEASCCICCHGAVWRAALAHRCQQIILPHFRVFCRGKPVEKPRISRPTPTNNRLSGIADHQTEPQVGQIEI